VIWVSDWGKLFMDWLNFLDWGKLSTGWLKNQPKVRWVSVSGKLSTGWLKW